MLRAKLFALQEEERLAKIASTRKMQVGTGSRSEKIRTYNYKDSRRAPRGTHGTRHRHRVTSTVCHTLAPPGVRTAPAHTDPRTHARTHARTRTQYKSCRLAACRCTDHRLGSNFALDGVLGGQIEPIVGACIAMDQQEQLEEMQAE